MADALALVGHPFMHVSRQFPSLTPGQSAASDEAIAQFCAQAELVLVTCDKDFQGRWVRSQLLARHGVEVMVFTEELAGLPEQHRRITTHLPLWESHLRRSPYGHRVWKQERRGSPKLFVGKQAKRRARKLAPTTAP